MKTYSMSRFKKRVVRRFKKRDVRRLKMEWCPAGRVEYFDPRIWVSLKNDEPDNQEHFLIATILDVYENVIGDGKYSAGDWFSCKIKLWRLNNELS